MTYHLKGRRFERLICLREADKNIDGRKAWFCLCDCGETVNVKTSQLINKHTRSCGCLQKDVISTIAYKHGHSEGGVLSPTFITWLAMKQRCCDPNQKHWQNYGGRGIKICDNWLNSFDNFLADMGLRPEGKTIDRIDVNGNYEPGNCRWSTPKEQRLNQRN